MPYIELFSGGLTGLSHWLSSAKELLIGRAPEADICIPDRRVSQRHARVVVSPEGAVFVEDLDSTNGTYVNGEKVTRRALRDGDEVLLLPDHILKFRYQAKVATQAVEKSVTDATREATTGNHARQEVLTRIEQDFAHAKKQNEDLALLMVAVDGFTQIAEKHGQVAAAMVLREVTKVISPVLRRDDVLARYNNDTFVILLHKLNEAGTVVLAQRVRRIVKYHHFIHASERIRVTVSLGICSLTKNMKNALDLIREVLANLDKAKSAGSDTINGSQSIRTIFRQIGNKHVA